MAKGNKVVPVRIDKTTLSLVDQEICLLNSRIKGEPLDRSSFIRKAIEEKLKHIWRSRKNGPFITVNKQSESGDE